MTLGRTIEIQLPEVLRGVATPTGALIHGCRRRPRRRRRSHATDVVGGDLGTRHLAEVAHLTEAARPAEVVGEAEAVHLAEVVHQTMIEVAEAPRGEDREEARVAPEMQQHPTTPS